MRCLPPDYIGEFTKILKETFDKGGNVVIPSFAVGRTQELLYFIREIKEKRLLPQYQGFEVYVDSPLAIEATNVFNKNVKSCFDEEAMALVEKGINPLIFPGLKTTITSDESRMINFDDKPKVIISASGMCEAGRIRHHLKHNLWRRECTICFVGYQAVGTLGRKLIEGAQSVKLFGENITVNARIVDVKGISGHADMNGLLTGKHERILALFRKLDHMTDRLGSLSRSHRPVLDGEHYLTDRELSGRLKISRRTLQEYRNEGRLPYIQLGGKVLYRESDIEKMLRDGYRKARSPL